MAGKDKLNNYMNRIFSKGEDLRTRIFEILAMCGFIVCIVTAITNIILEPGFAGFFESLAGALVSLVLLWYTRKTGKYALSMILTVIIIFLGLFTFLFFSGGGYISGMPCFFVFAVVFTAFMLDGVIMPIFVLIELAWYSFIMLVAFSVPESVTSDYADFEILLDTWIGTIVVSLSLAVTMYLQIRVYKNKEKELSDATQAAEEANRAKSDFLAKMSHDIRTPINTIMAMNEMIVANTSSARVREYVNDSNASGNILLSLIDDMLDLTRIEAGRIELHEKPLDTSLLFGETARLWKPQADRKGLEFVYRIDREVPAYIIGDEEIIRKIANNLLSNAVKYTKSGSVSMTVRWDGELGIIITDTGVGIAPEYLGKIFKPFERGVQDIYRETSGSGLGLAIVKELVDALKGDIACNSTLGEGTEFIVKLPLREDKETPEELRAQDRSANEGTQTTRRIVAPNARILVVDDMSLNRKVIENFLEPTLIHADSVESGYEALEMIDIKKYDLILMDLRMPGMDGAETLDKIKEDYPDFNTPVILLTADVMNDIEGRMLARGFSDFLFKPISSASLYETIYKFIPDKVISIEVEEDTELTVSEVEGYQDILMPYGINVMTAIENNAGDVGEFLNRTALFEEYADENISFFENAEYGENYYIKMHSLKSIARGIGAYLLAELAETVELRKDADFSGRSNELLINEFKRVREGLLKLRKEEEQRHG